MKNSIISLSEFIEQTTSIHLPQYHRGYICDIDNCANLFKQIAEFSDRDIQNKNLGVITLQKCDEYGNFMLIDGYQRLLTTYLLLLAIKDTYPDINRTKWCIEFKINNNDKYDILNIINGCLENDNNYNTKILSAYNFFASKLTETDFQIDKFLDNLSELQLINAMLESNISDSENIYYNLNPTFSQTDLIHNFVYKELKNSKLIHIFNTYWLNSEKNLGTNLNRFLIDYLTIQNNGLISKQNSLYKDFVEFFNKINNVKNKDEIIKHIYRYANYYGRIIESDIKDIELKLKLEEINGYKAYDTYPYLMEVFEDYEFAHINKHMLLEILNTIILFIQKRNENSNNKFAINFASLSKDINKMLALKDYTPKIITQIIDNDIDKNKSVINKKMTINQLINNK